MTADFEIVPGLVCGQSYRNPESEALAAAMRTCETPTYTGCGKSMHWAYTYRCRQCGRWMHGPCIDRHFGAVGCPATRDDENVRLQENPYVTGAWHVHYSAGSKDKCVSSGLCGGPDYYDAQKLAIELAAATGGEVSGPHFYIGGPECKLWTEGPTNT